MDVPPEGRESGAGWGQFEPVAAEVAREWLGFVPPTLPSLGQVGFDRRFARQGSRELIPRADLGRGDSMSVYVFYLPPGAPWVPATTFVEAGARG